MTFRSLRCLRWCMPLVAIACLPAAVRAAELVRIGNMLEGNYRAVAEKKNVYRVVHFEDKLYIAHGTSDAKEQNLAIYLDPETWKFGRDLDEAGKPVLIDAEEIRWARVIEGRLYFGNYDPVRGQRGAYHYRKRDGKWEAIKFGPDGHHRDFIAFDGKLFSFDGSGEKLPFPGIRMSADDGRTWSVVDLSGAHAGQRRPGWEFFTFKGRLYGGMMAGRVVIGGREMGDQPEADAPSVVVYTGMPDQPFEVAYASVKHMFGTEAYRPISHATEFKGRLVFRAPDLYVATSLAPDETKLKHIDTAPANAVIDIARAEDELYVLTREGDWSPDGPPPRYRVLMTRDAETFAQVAEFEAPAKNARNCGAFAVVGDQIVLGFEGGEFYRARIELP
jgi:hypothetical protein